MSLKQRVTLFLGIVIVSLIGLVSWWLEPLAPRLGGVTIAIVLGVVIGNLFFNNNTGAAGAIFAEKQLLPLAIVLLGVELQLATLVELGPVAALIIVLSIMTAIIVSVQIGQWLGFSRSFSVLMGAGNGICGSSAVAATSIAIEAEEADTGISISVVNLLGTVGIFLLPAVIRLLSLDNLQGGLLIGGTLQAFGHVVAAGFSVGDDVGNIATVVKMGRVLMLGPVVILLGAWMQSHRPVDEKSKARVRIPRFIFGFFLMSLLASSNLLPPEWINVFKTAGKILLVIAMAGIGMRIQLRTLFRSGLSAVLFGGLVTVVQITITLIAIILIA
ncbi:MAG: YeiH family protein [Anaerolineae bacterium]